jgi:hypothetical protein
MGPNVRKLNIIMGEGGETKRKGSSSRVRKELP